MKTSHLPILGIWTASVLAAFWLGGRWESGEQHQVDGEALDSGSAIALPERATLEARRPGQSGDAQPLPGEPADDEGIALRFGKAIASGSDLAALARQSVSDPNPIIRRLAFSRLLDAMTPENAPAIREELVALGVEGEQWNDFNYSWGALAGREAFDFASQSEEADLDAVIAGWASARPTEAVAMLDSLPAERQGERQRLAESVVAGLADSDHRLATDLVLRLASEGNERAPQLIEEVAGELLRGGNVLEASRWSESLPDGRVKGAAMRRVADRYARSDPEGAAIWAERYASEAFAAPVIEEVGSEWARRDPVAAVSWLEQLPEGDGPAAGLRTAFGDWEDRDPAAATEYLAGMSDSTLRDAAISGFARGYAWQDPLVAIAWAEDISDPGLRQESLTRAGQAFMRRDPEGARLWLEVSGLPPEAQQAVIAPDRRR